MHTLQLRNISKSFGGNKIIDNVSVNFYPGKINCLVGPNGAGKTTLFNIIGGFLLPDTGKVFIDDKDITALPPNQIARCGIGRLFQDVKIFENMTALENVMVAVPRQSGENPWKVWLKGSKIQGEERINLTKAQELLIFVGLKEKINVVAEALSQGQQKLLGIARILAAEPNILLLDEPCSGVHENLIEDIMMRVREIAESGKAIVIIEHNLRIVSRYSDHILFLNQGRIAAETEARKMAHVMDQGFFERPIFDANQKGKHFEKKL